VIAFVEDLAKEHLHVEQVLPALLKIWPDGHAQVADRLRRGLVSSDPGQARASLAGLWQWLAESDSLGLTTPPSDLLHELGSIICSRRQTALDTALDAAAKLLDDEQSPNREMLRTPEFLNMLAVGLSYLEVETTYRLDSQVSASGIPYDLVPEHRAKAARLAAVLSKHTGQESEVLRRWLESARIDPLPEVRNAVRID